MKSDPEESLGYDNANNKADCPPRLVSALPTPKEIAQRAWDNGHVPTFLKALCELLMCSDPWPASTDSEIVVKAKADGMARKLGFSDWVDAYHGLSDSLPNAKGDSQSPNQ